MNEKDYLQFKILISIIVVLFIAAAIATIVCIALPPSGQSLPKNPDPTGTDVPTVPESKTVLGQTADAGNAYQDQLMFFGESTTFHMISRGVLSGGTQTGQVIKPVNTTITLIYFDIENELVVAPSTGEKMTFGKAVRLEKPSFLILNFGINGLNRNYGAYGDQQKELFRSQYRSLIDIVKKESPDTQIIIQSVYPVADVADCEETFGCNAKEANTRIDAVNAWLKSLAESVGVKYTDSADALKDTNGNLDLNYLSDPNDCMHLNARGYTAVLQYLRQHAHPGYFE